mmetsp:Transcript_21147/g.45862  ORF Transcript_21147/g.45862 Transcript_21147/m.45862 type:complete len:253 (+) Transcript_21147:296-1054(+)
MKLEAAGSSAAVSSETRRLVTLLGITCGTQFCLAATRLLLGDNALNAGIDGLAAALGLLALLGQSAVGLVLYGVACVFELLCSAHTANIGGQVKWLRSPTLDGLSTSIPMPTAAVAAWLPLSQVFRQMLLLTPIFAFLGFLLAARLSFSARGEDGFAEEGELDPLLEKEFWSATSSPASGFSTDVEAAFSRNLSARSLEEKAGSNTSVATKCRHKRQPFQAIFTAEVPALAVAMSASDSNPPIRHGTCIQSN